MEQTVAVNQNETYLKKSFNSWKIPSLKEALRKNDIRFKSSLRKRELHDLLLHHILTERYKDVDDAKIAKKAIVIQSVFRGWSVRRSLRDQGPGIFTRRVCNNDMDPVTLNELDDIPKRFFFSYVACDQRVYGFDVRSMKQLLMNGQTRNPFNREEFPLGVVEACNRVYDRSGTTEVEIAAEPSLSIQDTINRKAFRFFHDAYLVTGCFVDHEWFLEVHRYGYIEMYRLLWEMWSNIPYADRRRYNSRNIRWFPHLTDVFVERIFNTPKLQMLLLTEFEKMMAGPVIEGDKITVVMWILIALTRVSEDARRGMPHLVI